MVCREAATVVMTTNPWNWHTAKVETQRPLISDAKDGGAPKVAIAMSEMARDATSSPGTFLSLGILYTM